MPLGMEVGLSAGDFVLNGDPSSPQKKRAQPHPRNFSPMSIVAKRLDGSRFKMPLNTEVKLGPCDVVLMPPPPHLKGAQPTIFCPCLCGQTAEWMKMPLGAEVDLGPGHIVLDGDPVPPHPRKRGTAASIFRSMSIVPWSPISTPQSLAHAHYLMPCSNAAKMRKPLKLAGVPQTTGPISAASGPKFTILC